MLYHLKPLVAPTDARIRLCCCPVPLVSLNLFAFVVSRTPALIAYRRVLGGTWQGYITVRTSYRFPAMQISEETIHIW